MTAAGGGRGACDEPAAGQPAGVSTVAVLAAGIGFTEGPLYMPDGHVLVTSVSRGLLYRVPLDGGPPAVAAETGGGPNGLALGPENTVFVAQNGNATIQSRSPRPVKPGLQTVRSAQVNDLLVEKCSAPNDLVFGPDGRIWFTDPGPPTPCTRAFDPQSGKLETVVTGIAFPNGLAFSEDGSELYIADSETGNVFWASAARVPVTEPRLFGAVPGSSPDGIAFDRRGNMFIAGFASDAVIVLGPDGKQVARLSTGERSRPTNLCFAGPGLSRLVVTAASGGRLLEMAGDFQGRPVSPWSAPNKWGALP